MAISKQISSLTGRKRLDPLLLKNPYGVLGKKPLPQDSPVIEEEPVIIPEEIPSPILNELQDGGGIQGSPAPGSLSMGQQAVFGANEESNMANLGKGVLGVASSMVSPDVAMGVGKATNSTNAALGTYSAMNLAGSGHPILGMATLGMKAAAKAVAQADMADTINKGEMSPEFAGVSNSLTAKNTTPSDDLANIGFETLGSKANQAIQGMQKADSKPYGFLGSKMLNAIKSGDLGENWSDDSLLDSLAREHITPESTRDIGKKAEVQTTKFDETVIDPTTIGPGAGPGGMDSTVSDAINAAQTAPFGIHGLGLMGVGPVSKSDMSNTQAMQQGMVDAEQNSLADPDSGFFGGTDFGSDSNGSVAGLGDPPAGDDY